MSPRSRARTSGSSCARATPCRRCCSSSLATLVVFHFALPTGSGDDAAYGLLWVAIVFTALLGLARAWAPEREGGALDGLVLAPCDRSAIWLGKTLAMLAFLDGRRGRRAAGVRALLRAVDARRDRRRRAREHRHLRRRLAPRRDGRGEPGREVILPLLFLPLAIPLVVGGVGAGISPNGAKFLSFLGLYDVVFAILAWATFEYVVTE